MYMTIQEAAASRKVSPRTIAAGSRRGFFGFADPKVGPDVCKSMNRMDFHTVSDPRELALRDAALACAHRVA